MFIFQALGSGGRLHAIQYLTLTEDQFTLDGDVAATPHLNLVLQNRQGSVGSHACCRLTFERLPAQVGTDLKGKDTLSSGHGVSRPRRRSRVGYECLSLTVHSGARAFSLANAATLLFCSLLTGAPCDSLHPSFQVSA